MRGRFHRLKFLRSQPGANACNVRCPGVKGFAALRRQAPKQTGLNSMSEDDRSVSRSLSPEREKSEPPPAEAEAAEEFKLFVGGISWHMDDRELRDSKRAC